MTDGQCGHGTTIMAGRLLGVCTCWAPTPGDIVAAAVQALTDEGCTCDPRIEFSEFEPAKYRVTATHDRWCPRWLAVKAVDN